MPVDTNATFISEKNLPENRPVFLYRVHEYNGTDDLLMAAHDEDVEFNSETYSKFPITHDSIPDNGRGEIDTVNVRVSNVSRLIQAYLELYDFRGKKVTITQVFLDQLADADAKISYIFYIDNYKASDQDVEFQLTSRFDVIDVMLPLGAYNRNYCRWKFKSTECGYVGAESVCNKTKQDCRDNKNNVQRYGGFPSIPQRRLFT